MIPVRLELKDFLSYTSPPPLDFTAFDVACLSGDNGAGKSAILDAMTWALFGRARGCESGQNQDRLIRDGCDETVVDFTFELGDATYRIVRRRARSAKGDTKGDVRFLVSDGGDWKNIADETLKATDEKIGAVLRMDYQTFVASAFFIQGRSEDFLARMNASERKDVFARLLDLGVYEELEEAARGRAREADRGRQDVAARIGELEVASVDIAALECELQQTNDNARTLEADTRMTTDDLDAARTVLAEIETKQALLEREEQALASNEDVLAQTREQIQAKTDELTEIDAMLAHEGGAREAVREIEVLRTDDASARAQQTEASELKHEAAQVTATIEAERKAIEQRIRDHRSRIGAIEKELGPLRDASTSITRIEEQLNATADTVASLADARSELEAHQSAGTRCDEQVRALDETIKAAGDAMAVLAGGGGECPVCGNTLDAKHRAEAKKRLQADVTTAKGQQQTARAGVATERKEAKRIAEEIRRLESARVSREQLVASREGLLARLERLEPLSDELDGLRAAAGVDEATLGAGSYAAELSVRVADLEAQAAALYDQEAHEHVLDRLKALEPYAALLGAIEEAARRRGRVCDDFRTAQLRAEQLGAEAAAHVKTIEGLREGTSARPAAVAAVETCQERLTELRRLENALSGARARLEERLEAARRVEQELEAARVQEQALATEIRRYRRLIEAFGRDGIPGHVIDNARPELEEDANRILGRLSDHEMSVRFNLQRDTKSGKIKETFDVLVHHDGGVRDYAMFSGGEAFRVAFAVRLAMSKLLVGRAGARLETLVIDEGFGTQDPQGRERLVEAVNLARDDFAKIVVITHLDDLKDQFGTQITVTKGPDGSLVEISGA